MGMSTLRDVQPALLVEKSKSISMQRRGPSCFFPLVHSQPLTSLVHRLARPYRNLDGLDLLFTRPCPLRDPRVRHSPQSTYSSFFPPAWKSHSQLRFLLYTSYKVPAQRATVSVLPAQHPFALASNLNLRQRTLWKTKNVVL